MPRVASLILCCAAGVLCACDSTSTPLSPTDLVDRAGTPQPPSPAPPPPEPAAPPPPPPATSGTQPAPVGNDDHDVVTVERGVLDFSGGRGELQLRGARRFTLRGEVSATGGIIAPIQTCQAPVCEPGAPVSLHALWAGTDLRATVTLDDRTYRLGSALSEASAMVEFAGTILAPPFTRRGAERVSAPFTFSGQFFTGGEPPDAETITLNGRGVATVWFRQPAGASSWQVERVRYEFDRQKSRTWTDAAQTVSRR